jgi:hypothetical protein
MNLRRYSYTLTWSLAAIVVLGLIGLVFYFRPPPDKQMRIDPKSYIPAEKRLEQERRLAGENPLVTNPPDVNVKGTEIALSSEDGSIKMRLSSSEAFSREGVVNLPAASVEFFLKDQRKLNISATNLTYSVGEEVAEVDGNLSGEIPSMKMRFTTQGLIWDKRSAKITLLRATVADPSFRAVGQDITYDLRTDELTVSGTMRVEM